MSCQNPVILVFLTPNWKSIIPKKALQWLIRHLPLIPLWQRYLCWLEASCREQCSFPSCFKSIRAFFSKTMSQICPEAQSYQVQAWSSSAEHFLGCPVYSEDLLQQFKMQSAGECTSDTKLQKQQRQWRGEGPSSAPGTLGLHRLKIQPALPLQSGATEE